MSAVKPPVISDGYILGFWDKSPHWTHPRGPARRVIAYIDHVERQWNAFLEDVS